MSLEKLTIQIRENQDRLTKKHTHTYPFKLDHPEDILYDSLGIIVSSMGSYCNLSTLCSRVGNQLRRKKEFPQDLKASIYVGFFVLTAFLDLRLLEISYNHGHKKNNLAGSKYRSYSVKPTNFEEIMNLMKEVLDLKEDRASAQFGYSKAPEAWTGFTHPSGVAFIKKSVQLQEDTRVFEKSQNYLFQLLNKLGRQPWRINQQVLRVYGHYLQPGHGKNPFRHMSMKDDLSYEKMVKDSLKLRSESIYRIAEMFGPRPFYQVYNFDFRGRIYPNTIFLNEQGSEDARALLLFHEGQPITEEGRKYLLMHGANCWGLDNLPINSRVQAMQDMIESIVKIARDPYKHIGWMEAEKPFSFLAFCFEMEKVEREGLGTEVNLPVSIDASCNGSQHLSALSLDETIARFVNIIPGDKPGDLYEFIAKKAWQRLEKMEKSLSPQVRDMFPIVLKRGIALQEQFDKAKLKGDKDEIAEASKALLEFRKTYKPMRSALFCVYWNKVKDPKLRRKILKRPTMTLAYGGTRHGFGTQILEDIRGENDHLRYLEAIYAYKLGALTYDLLHEELKGPARLLRLFRHIAGKYNDKGRDVRWKVPVTGFIVRQAYRHPHTGRVRLFHGRKEYRLKYEDWTKCSLHNQHQKLALSPNLIHSLDAAHMAMVIDNAEYSVAGVHDSYLSLPESTKHLMADVRHLFVELYKEDPLADLLKQLGFLDLMPERGTLDLEVIKKSEFAFS